MIYRKTPSLREIKYHWETTDRMRDQTIAELDVAEEMRVSASTYMLLKRAGIRVSMISRNNVPFEMEIGDKSVLSMDSSTERLFIYWIFEAKANNKAGEWLRKFYKKDITKAEINSIIKFFKDTHELRETDGFKFDAIPLYAGYEDVFKIPIRDTYLEISEDDEMELMEIAFWRQNPHVKVYSSQWSTDAYQPSDVHPHAALPNSMESWFARHRQMNGWDFGENTEGSPEQDEELAVSFLNQHGLDKSSLQDFQLEETQTRKMREKKEGFTLDTKTKRNVYRMFVSLIPVFAFVPGVAYGAPILLPVLGRAPFMLGLFLSMFTWPIPILTVYSMRRDYVKERFKPSTPFAYAILFFLIPFLFFAIPGGILRAILPESSFSYH
ncbi:MAG: hypothetical protein LBM08_00695 [Dysgonamonadaceae bacterium]|jgi:hypothetical protein|nr:hypothetical protein [Dysgonamonadaceae bacterium]